MKYSLVLSILIIISVNFTLIQDHSGKAIISVDLQKQIGEMKPVWAWFGYDEPNFTYMKDGKKLLTELSALSPVPVYVRAHNLLTSGDGAEALKWGSTNAYTEDAKGNPVYNWTIIDKIFDTYIERGMKPLAQMGFMPEALSIHPEPYKHNWKPGDPYDAIYTGWRFPPKDYKKWGELIYQWVKHSVDRYGEKEVETWYWELWNEPDSKYWGGTVEEYCKLYDFSADGVKRALPSAHVGGPHITGPANSNAAKFLNEFLRHCESGINNVTAKTGAPLDFIAFHAKGSPRFIDGTVQMNMGTQIRQISKGFEIVSSNPRYKDLPVVIGECDPEGCAACNMVVYPQNGYRNGTMYSSYTASSFSKIYDLALFYKVNLIGVVSWSFEFENQPWFFGFRDLATNGVDKPVLNVFRMFGMMKGTRVEAKSTSGFSYSQVIDSGVTKNKSDLGAVAVRDKKSVSIMIWNYNDNDKPAPNEAYMVQIKNIPAEKAIISEFRIDRDHSNSYETWKKMGSPKSPSPEQVSQLEKSGQLEMTGLPESININSGLVSFPSVLPRQGVALFKIDWK